jgi:5-oxoprolinase (ATP-hydrolysing)
VYEIQEPTSTFYTVENVPTLFSHLDVLTNTMWKEFEKQGFAPRHIQTECMLNIWYNGTDTAHHFFSLLRRLKKW